MKRYYTRACNFYYGKESKLLIRKKKTLPLNGLQEISFDHLEIISRKSKKKISIKDLKKLSKSLQKQIIFDLEKISLKCENFSYLDFKKIPNIIGVLNLTPDSFSDGGKFNKADKGIKHAFEMIKAGANLIDIGGESTRPGSKTVNSKNEWNRISRILRSICK